MRCWPIISLAAMPIAAGLATTAVVAMGGPFICDQRISEAAVGWSVFEGRDDSLCWRRTTDREFDRSEGEDLGSSAARARERVHQRTYEETDGCGPCGHTEDGFRHWVIVETGWPCTAFWGWKAEDVPPLWTENPKSVEHRGCLFDVPCNRKSIAWNGSLEIPYAPVWPGLIANTLLYAMAWWAIIVPPLAIRRAVRRRRGLCPECGYDCSSSGSNCPECGTLRSAARPG